MRACSCHQGASRRRAASAARSSFPSCAGLVLDQCQRLGRAVQVQEQVRQGAERERVAWLTRPDPCAARARRCLGRQEFGQSRRARCAPTARWAVTDPCCAGGSGRAARTPPPPGPAAPSPRRGRWCRRRRHPHARAWRSLRAIAPARRAPTRWSRELSSLRHCRDLARVHGRDRPGRRRSRDGSARSRPASPAPPAARLDRPTRAPELPAHSRRSAGPGCAGPPRSSAAPGRGHFRRRSSAGSALPARAPAPEAIARAQFRRPSARRARRLPATRLAPPPARCRRRRVARSCPRA